MIIDGSYFVHDIYIPQVGEDASTIANDRVHMEGFINEREPEILEMGLGTSLYNEFDAQFTSTGILPVDADQKWKDLLNGTEYAKGEDTYRWRGLTYTRGQRKLSLIAYYVYYWYVKSGTSHQTTLGTVKPQAKNAEPVTAIPKLTDAWRKLHDWYGGSVQGHNYFRGYVKGVFFEDHYLGHRVSKSVSLYDFLSHNQDVYPSWEFTPIENKTTWGV